MNFFDSIQTTSTTTNPAAFTDPSLVPWFSPPTASSSFTEYYPYSLRDPSIADLAPLSGSPIVRPPTSSSADTTSGGGRGTERSNIQEKDGPRMKSCAACRIRRVKCKRDVGETDCQKCKERSLVCTQLPSIPRKKPLVRTGRRIEQAQTLFNSKTNSNSGKISGFAANGRTRSTRRGKIHQTHPQRN